MDTQARQEFLERRREVHQREHAAISEFVSAACAGDAERFLSSLKALDCVRAGWRRAMRAMAGKSCSKEFRRRFLACWVYDGDGIRSVVNDDLVLVDALKAMLPRYTGRGRTLYRGDSAFNRRRRTYGLSWTTSRDVGLGFAQAASRLYTSGTVLLQVHAPKEAIICAPMHNDNRYGEMEYLVDRRRLRDVRVLERVPHVAEGSGGRPVTEHVSFPAN
jgi:hypothetical protein